MKDTLFQGMKVLSIDPGWTHYDPEEQKWYYTIKVNGKTYFGDHWPSANMAKQKMREKISELRKKHLIGGSKS